MSDGVLRITATITVYCEGDPDNPHKRCTIARWNRIDDVAWSPSNVGRTQAAVDRLPMWSTVNPGEVNAEKRKAILRGWRQYGRASLRCRDCGLHPVKTDDNMKRALDALHGAGVTEVSLRVLL